MDLFTDSEFSCSNLELSFDISLSSCVYHAAMRILKQAARPKQSLLNVEGNSNELKHEEWIGFLFVYNRIILLQQIKSKGRYILQQAMNDAAGNQ